MLREKGDCSVSLHALRALKMGLTAKTRKQRVSTRLVRSEFLKGISSCHRMLL